MSAKFPRTPHLPWSPGGTTDDKRLRNAAHLIGPQLVITEKLDGGNLCFTSRAVYARSHVMAVSGELYALAKAAHAEIQHIIPTGMSIFMEDTQWVHSIVYDQLPHCLHVIAVRDDESDYWFPWSEGSLSVVEVANEIALPTVPFILTTSFCDEDELQDTTEMLGGMPSVYGPEREGVVVRLAGGFTDFSKSTAKWVRAGHVVSDEHWMKGTIREQNC